jgi:hypothetical protein
MQLHSIIEISDSYMISRARKKMRNFRGVDSNFTGLEVRKNHEKKRVNSGLSESASQEIRDSDTACAGRKKIEKFLKGAGATTDR